MEVYNKLNSDLKETIDNIIWQSNKPLISNISFIHRRLRLTLYEKFLDIDIIPYRYNNYLKFIDWLCWDIISPNIHNCGDTRYCIYKYCNDNNLGIKISQLIEKIECTGSITKKNLMNEIYNDLGKLIEKWCNIYVNHEDDLYYYITKLCSGSIVDFETWFEETFDEEYRMIEDDFDRRCYKDHTPYSKYFCQYICEVTLYEVLCFSIKKPVSWSGL